MRVHGAGSGEEYTQSFKLYCCHKSLSETKALTLGFYASVISKGNIYRLYLKGE